MENELLELDKLKKAEESWLKDFSKTLNPCSLAIAASYREIINAKKENLKKSENEQEDTQDLTL